MTQLSTRRLSRGVAAGLALTILALLGPDLFLAIPWPIRWALGEVGVVAGVVGVAAWTYRINPPRPWRLVDPATAGSPRLHRALAITLHLVGLSLPWAFFSRPGYWGVFDWDWDLEWFGAVRRAIVHHGEFPWWHALNSGGVPLAADPQVGLASPVTALVLLLGTPTGLRWSVVLALMLAIEGARRLARLWLSDPWAVALAAAVYGWNGFILLTTVMAPPLTFAHPLLPWLLLYGFQIDRGLEPAIKLGAVAALGVLTVIQYPTAYAAIITAWVLVWGVLGRPRPDRPRQLALIAVAIGVFLTLAGWRLALTGHLMADFPRKLQGAVNATPTGFVGAMVHRLVPPPLQFPAKTAWHHEEAGYIGLIPLAAAILSLAGPWRWWHTLAFAGFALALGTVHPLHPSYWLSGWPVFSSMHQVGRWRFPGLLGLGLAAGSTIQTARATLGRWRWLPTLLALAALVDLATYAHQCLPLGWSNRPVDQHVPGPPVPNLVSLHRWESGGVPEASQATRLGYAVIEGYSPLLGYDRRRPTLRLWRDHPEYRGEFHSGDQALVPRSWSPNRVVLDGLQPGQAVEINQNPSSYWLVNGQRAFPNARCVELNERFVVCADDQGRLVLEARPPTHVFVTAAALTLFGFLLALIGARTAHRLRPGSV